MPYSMMFQIEPEVLEAGDIVAKHKEMERREVFRSMETAEVLDEAAMILGPGDKASAFAHLAPVIRRRVALARCQGGS